MSFCYFISGKGIYSLSFGTLSKFPLSQSDLACSIRFFEFETKFHQIYLSVSNAFPPISISLAFSFAVIEISSS